MAKLATLVFGLALAMVLSTTACGVDGPEELEISVKVNQEQLSPKIVRVKQGDKVTLRIESDQDGEVHLHGYDIERTVSLGQIVDLYFVANATGRFKITFHAEETVTSEEREHQHQHKHNEKEQNEETAIGFLEVRP